MKHILSIAAIALLGSSVMSVPVVAQTGIDADVDVGVDAGVDVGGRDLDADTNVDASADIDASAGTDGETTTGSATGDVNAGASVDAEGDTASSALQEGAEANAALQAFSGGEIRVADLLSAQSFTDAQIEAMLSDEQQAAEIQTAIEANAQLAGALEEQGIDLSSIVAATVNEDGTITLFTADVDSTSTAATGGAGGVSPEIQELAQGFFTDEAQGTLLPDAELRAQFELLTGEQRVMLLEECQSVVAEGNVTDAWLDLCRQIRPL